jgi:hypothetical protein
LQTGHGFAEESELDAENKEHLKDLGYLQYGFKNCFFQETQSSPGFPTGSERRFHGAVIRSWG